MMVLRIFVVSRTCVCCGFAPPRAFVGDEKVEQEGIVSSLRGNKAVLLSSGSRSLCGKSHVCFWLGLTSLALLLVTKRLSKNMFYVC